MLFSTLVDEDIGAWLEYIEFIVGHPPKVSVWEIFHHGIPILIVHVKVDNHHTAWLPLSRFTQWPTMLGSERISGVYLSLIVISMQSQESLGSPT